MRDCKCCICLSGWRDEAYEVGECGGGIVLWNLIDFDGQIGVEREMREQQQRGSGVLLQGILYIDMGPAGLVHIKVVYSLSLINDN